jgi:hypothetical protein
VDWWAEKNPNPRAGDSRGPFKQAIEFIADLSADPVHRIPREAATQLPTSGRVLVIVLTAEADDDGVDSSAAALAKPSVARLDRLVTAERMLLQRSLGRLNLTDLEAVRTAWNQHMRL